MHTRFAMVALAAALAAPAQAQNLVANGDFESPAITTSYVFVTRGETTITSWLVDAPADGQGVDLISANAGNPDYAHDGLQAIDLAGSPGPGTLRQTLTTVAGVEYRVRFWLSSNGGPFTNAMSLRWDEATIATFNSPPFGTWQRECRTLHATGTSTVIEFVGLRGGNAGAFLDTVTVEPYNRAACPGNVDDDCGVTLTDLAGLLTHFGTPGGAGAADGDLDGDGDVDLTDLALLLTNFGANCDG